MIQHVSLQYCFAAMTKPPVGYAKWAPTDFCHLSTVVNFQINTFYITYPINSGAHKIDTVLAIH